MKANRKHNRFLLINFLKISSVGKLERVAFDNHGRLMYWRGTLGQCF